MYQREIELQSVATERISNLKSLEAHKQQMRELEVKLKEFDKYEAVVASKFDYLETLMSEMSVTKSKFQVKEKELRQRNHYIMLCYFMLCYVILYFIQFLIDLEEREKRLNEALKLIQELRKEKESLESQRDSLENENKDQCSEFNCKIYELNTEIKEKKRTIDLLSGEKEVLLSDLKSITNDRDKTQKECSNALKEIAELAVSDSFESESKDLASLERSVSWIKTKCIDLNNSKVSNDFELINMKQTIQELEKHINSKSKEIKISVDEIEKMKNDLETKDKDIQFLRSTVECLTVESDLVENFKKRVKNLGILADNSDELELFEIIIEKLGKNTSELILESLKNEVRNNHITQYINII